MFLSIMFTETILSHKTNREKFVTKSLSGEHTVICWFQDLKREKRGRCPLLLAAQFKLIDLGF